MPPGHRPDSPEPVQPYHAVQPAGQINDWGSFDHRCTRQNGFKKSRSQVTWTLPLCMSPDECPTHRSANMFSANMFSANMVSVAPIDCSNAMRHPQRWCCRIQPCRAMSDIPLRDSVPGHIEQQQHGSPYMCRVEQQHRVVPRRTTISAAILR